MARIMRKIHMGLNDHPLADLKPTRTSWPNWLCETVEDAEAGKYSLSLTYFRLHKSRFADKGIDIFSTHMSDWRVTRLYYASVVLRGQQFSDYDSMVEEAVDLLVAVAFGDFVISDEDKWTVTCAKIILSELIVRMNGGGDPVDMSKLTRDRRTSHILAIAGIE